jgi:hypothetical protein
MSTPTTVTAAAAGIGGLGITALGADALLDPTSPNDALWFLLAAAAAALITVSVLGLRRLVQDIPLAHGGLAVAALGLALFTLAHIYTLVDRDTALLLFSVFMIAGSLGMILGGTAIARRWRGPARFVPLLCGAWPIVTIPVGSALGDVPHFSAILGWGLCWLALAATLLSATAARVPAHR